MDTINLIGTLAAVCSMASFAPQAWKVVRSSEAGGLSTKMYVLTVSGFSLWLIYGLQLGQWPLIVTNGVCLLLSSFILAMKILPRAKRRAVGNWIARRVTPS